MVKVQNADRQLVQMPQYTIFSMYYLYMQQYTIILMYYLYRCRNTQFFQCTTCTDAARHNFFDVLLVQMPQLQFFNVLFVQMPQLQFFNVLFVQMPQHTISKAIKEEKKQEKSDLRLKHGNTSESARSRQLMLNIFHICVAGPYQVKLHVQLFITGQIKTHQFPLMKTN